MELLILLGLVTVSPWVIRLLTQARVLPLAVLVLVCGVVAGPLFYSFQVGTQLSVDRILLVVVVAKCFVLVWNRQVGQFQLRHIDCMLVLLTLWLLLSSIPASAPPKEMSPSSRWLTFMAIPLAMYGIARLSQVTTQDLRILTSALIGLGIFLGITGIFEVANLHALVIPRYIVDPTNWEFLGRARGPLLNPTGNGVVLTIAFSGSLVRLLQASQRRDQIIYLLATCVIGIGIVATLTRSVWIGGTLVVMCASWIHLRRYVPAMALIGMSLLVMAVTVAPQDNLIAMKRDKHLSAADAQRSIELRPVLAMIAWEMFKDSPLIGHGYGGYFDTSLPYLSSRSQEMSFDAVRPYMQHNVILSLMVDAGLIATCLFLGSIGYLGIAAWRLATSRQFDSEVRTVGMLMLGCLSSYLFNGMFHDVSVIPMANNFLFLLAGVTTTVHSLSKSPSFLGKPAVSLTPAAQPTLIEDSQAFDVDSLGEGWPAGAGEEHQVASSLLTADFVGGRRATDITLPSTR